MIRSAFLFFFLAFDHLVVVGCLWSVLGSHIRIPHKYQQITIRMSEVRKRALDEDSNNHDEDDQSTKRVAKEELHNIENVMVMKLLCPSSIIGAIIGRGGKSKRHHDC